jgi:four helix bundle protein
VDKASMTKMSYKDLEVRQLPRKIVIDIHRGTMTKLPKIEMFEESNQVRKSSKSVKSTITAGYGRRRHKQEFLRFLFYAIISNDEIIDHLETLLETESLTDAGLYQSLRDRLEVLAKNSTGSSKASKRST